MRSECGCNVFISLWGAKSRTIQANSQQKVGLEVSLAFDKLEPLGGQGVAKVRALLSAYISTDIAP